MWQLFAQLPHASVSYVNTANADTLPQCHKPSPHPCMSFLSSPLFLCQTGSHAVQAALYVGEDDFTSSWFPSHLPNARIKGILPNLALVFLLTFQRTGLCLSSPLSLMHSEPHSSCWVGIWWFKCSPWCCHSKPLIECMSLVFPFFDPPLKAKFPNHVSSQVLCAQSNNKCENFSKILFSEYLFPKKTSFPHTGGR